VGLKNPTKKLELVGLGKILLIADLVFSILVSLLFLSLSQLIGATSGFLISDEASLQPPCE
jgi:hypothetical protein